MMIFFGADDACDPDLMSVNLGNISVTVLPSSNRLFPYRPSVGDSEFRGVLDGAVPIYPSDSVPFFSTYYRRLYVSVSLAST